MKKHIIVLALMILLSGCSRLAEEPIEEQYYSPPMETTTEYLQLSKQSMPEGSSILAAERIIPSVVGLAVKAIEPESGAIIKGIGSGVIVTTEGHILTNHHVAGNAQEINAIFADGRILAAKKLWSDSNLDLAIIKIEGDSFIAAQTGSADDLVVGQRVIAVGTPLDMSFQHTVTSGIVSALNRRLDVPGEGGLMFMENLIQTDASINPGNSGGPLCDLNGRVIGINSVKVTGAEGLGFAIPIDICVMILDKIIEDGEFITPYLGLYAIDSMMAKYYGEEIDEGICVLNVDPQSPAYSAGIRFGDCILTVDGQRVSTMQELRLKLYELGVDRTVEIEYERDGSTYSATCKLITRPIS